MDLYTVDRHRTEMYESIYNEPCTCSTCKNFRVSFPKHCPKANEVINEMGLSAEQALEIIDYYHPYQGVHSYSAYFSVAGKLREDNLTIFDKDAKITLYRLDTDKPIYSNTDMLMPSFILEVQVDELLWEIDEAED